MLIGGCLGGMLHAMKGMVNRRAASVLALIAILTAPACQGGISEDARVAPGHQVPIVSQLNRGYHEANATLSNAANDLAIAANDAAWAIAAAPIRILFGLTPFETGYTPLGVVDHQPDKADPEARRRRRRRALGLPLAAEDRVESRRAKHRLALRRAQLRSN